MSKETFQEWEEKCRQMKEPCTKCGKVMDSFGEAVAHAFEHMTEEHIEKFGRRESIDESFEPIVTIKRERK